MSIRAFLYAESGTKPKELAESKTWIPLCWLTLPSALEVERGSETGAISINRNDAIDRLETSVPLLTKLFPEFHSVRESADVLLAVLKKTRAATIGIELGDHFAIAPEEFPAALLVVVKALRAKSEKCSFIVPGRPVYNAFTGKSTPGKAKKLTTTRDVLCHAAGLDPATDDKEIEREQLIGCLS
jgi:hypothetical protein